MKPVDHTPVFTEAYHRRGVGKQLTAAASRSVWKARDMDTTSPRDDMICSLHNMTRLIMQGHKVTGLFLYFFLSLVQYINNKKTILLGYKQEPIHNGTTRKKIKWQQIKRGFSPFDRWHCQSLTQVDCYRCFWWDYKINNGKSKT